ncbi:demethoxyubiquinone hydroxylase family protein [Marinobacter adhaerens]|jgi:ubiquinone biosynthesis monooxygenase Coq7|uniref:Coq7 family protein n=2 Tax=Marinobacter adhaerens TaxID=1033846 RepID=E4PKM5_MARAH|nr:demethoxyubiquinone hydroxylase family protein [Marinobacter adhaerens]ADP98501.1 Coq7 family protein [Marinobacter adhaerens HP15]
MMAELQIDGIHHQQLSQVGVSRQFEQELRCSHAGETGAVWIYRGILATRPQKELLDFATEHLASESEHLRFFNQLQCCYRPSLLLPLWRLAGFLTGLIPALMGKQAVFATIEAVETFVDLHYQEQIKTLSPHAWRESERAILAGFETCRLDEVHHRDEAGQYRSAEASLVLRLWTGLVGAGSKAAVQFARLI